MKFGKRQSKINFLYYARICSEPFPLTQGDLQFLAILRWPPFFSGLGQQEIQHQTVRRSGFKSSNKRLQQFLDDPHETVLEKLIIDNNSLAWETMLSCRKGRMLIKSTLRPIFEKKKAPWSINCFIFQYWAKPNQPYCQRAFGKEAGRKHWL